ncbi:hypothetical protein V1J52_09805 [Streptomyces sp. TRM 70351]|uniref:hypothetical protein n=1 Tax=Streptomyces sp. TRM 70351 TaxID=3116552 RepID=UPI002E7AC866|nr:hypothetical protein [Streptomyces sp. TRM 70351]MEE1928482.1 hypothetical protein [Streptomyces sp. TRM 70351]
MIPHGDGQDPGEADGSGGLAGEPQAAAEDDLTRRFDELGKVNRDHLEGLGR